MGPTPTATQVGYGSHTVKVELTGHKPTSKTVSVRAAQMSLPFHLESAQVYVKCNLSGPMDAKVLMDGKPVGSLPRSIRCAAGTHSFTVVSSSGSSYTVTRHITPKKKSEFVNVWLGSD